MPTRNSIRLSGETAALASAIPRWTSTAQRTAATTLGNSASKPSPVVLYDTAPVLLDLRIDQLPRPAPDTFRFNLLYGARRFVRLFFTRLG
jgi:hypothetical protein